MPVVSEDRKAEHTETWRVAVCDSCGTRRDVAQMGQGGGDIYGRHAFIPPDWVGVYDGYGHAPKLVFCSTGCLKRYH